MATKSVDKSSKKDAPAKAKVDKKPLAKSSDASARRAASSTSKTSIRPAAPTSGKAATAKPAAATKSPAPKLSAAPSPSVKAKAQIAPAKAPAAKASAPKTVAAGKQATAKSSAQKPAPKKAAVPAKPVDKKAAASAAAKPQPAKGGKPAASKSATKQASTPAPGATKTKTTPAKVAPQPASKSSSKPASKSAPAPKEVSKAAAKEPAKTVVEKKLDVKAAQKISAAQSVDASGKKPGGKTSKSSGGAKTMTESPAMKKPLVGQKPRSDRPASMSLGAPLAFMPKANQSVNESSVKSSPASQEAKLDFKVNDHVVYPAHGVGRIVGIERQVIAGIVNELFLIDFEQEKMKLRVPTAKAKAVGMRALSDPALVKKAVETLKGRARIKRTMWSRRAQEYEAKINSGDIIAVAEVVRDLFRASDQPEQSYSERQLFEAAIDRLAREVAAVRKADLAAALTELEGALQQKKAA